MPEDSPSIYTIMAERVANAVLGKINALIGSHNTNEQAHQDIRGDIPSYTSELNNDSGFITISSVPSASSTTPSADTANGGVGTGTTWARSDHTHPKSSLYAEASHTHSEYVNPTIVDNLTTNDATKVLSAKQGKVLNDMIGDAISYINQ